mmetsp:Transcript_16660/g.36992  ORF Transcript_16660/g.36992 Transcript_16660/m.36992 type:complete len:128 (+) Transcript_16660:153-536(+)|eukprot:CAMPEP_0178470346 /NCGR_PEP_ID=MMETSP0696-20121128/479_1 /TAXON_ID=265572 /ORGANISM="Extubocellulus spinifer, Strain CCMP396" /LENGTH=127 /DNA_ID=CAMNT_0020097445 /DNA_START=44 /DNA_END=427 /DNA_ORIENTATION=+
MPILLKIRWTIKDDLVEDFKKNQAALMTVMQDHPGVIVYHADYPEDNVSEWTELYNNNETFKAHLANERGKAPLGVCVDACSEIECRCWGDPDDGSRDILAGFGATYMESGENSILLHPRADKDSTV